MCEFELKKNYRDCEELRRSFNSLAERTFGLNFEDWYQNGYWGDNYNPYSMVHDGQVIANVSVNRTDFIWNGRRKHLIQLGTVMTEEAYRNQGLIRRLMEEIEQDYQDADGVYLFANDSVLDFYPKFGFQKAEEYQYSKQVSNEEARSIEKVSMTEKKEWDVLQQAIQRSIPAGALEMVDNSELYMLYVTKFMQECVYYDRTMDAYVIAGEEDGSLLIHAVIASEKVDLEQVLRAFGSGIKEVLLGFTPADTDGWTKKLVQEEDTTLFVKGEGLKGFSEEAVMVPMLAHA